MSDCNDVKKSRLLALAIFFVITGVLYKTTPLWEDPTVFFEH